MGESAHLLFAHSLPEGANKAVCNDPSVQLSLMLFWLWYHQCVLFQFVLWMIFNYNPMWQFLWKKKYWVPILFFCLICNSFQLSVDACVFIFVLFLFSFSSADISVTLQNQGRDAFKPELYGDSIIVNTHINLEGSRTYRLKSKSGWW